ncbi:MAG: peptidoglycan/xylan/chitin deacetylase (PgdA/CDA1 family) [Candidatus Marinamargulisbacteria bacterium]|jgi:peptidoglycan/xylan/chitin deacetylase (PgdA/CDA1 family)
MHKNPPGICSIKDDLSPNYAMIGVLLESDNSYIQWLFEGMAKGIHKISEKGAYLYMPFLDFFKWKPYTIVKLLICACLLGASVVEGQPFFIEQGPTTNKVVALTFDDGPNKRFTPLFLDILKGEGVKATFFLTGKNVSYYPTLSRRIRDEGHEIGNHSYDHKELTRLTSSEIRLDLKKTQTIFKTRLNKAPTLFRPPFGAYNRRVLKICRDFFQSVVLWDVSSADTTRKKTPETIRGRVLSKVQPGSIVLFHDSNRDTLSALLPVILGLKAAGYGFVSVSELYAPMTPTTLLVPTSNEQVPTVNGAKNKFTPKSEANASD